jgi:hypothetical protein
VHARCKRFQAFEKRQDQQAYTQRRLLPLVGREVQPGRQRRWIMLIAHDAVSLCLVRSSLAQNRWRVSRKVWAVKLPDPAYPVISYTEMGVVSSREQNLHRAWLNRDKLNLPHGSHLSAQPWEDSA